MSARPTSRLVPLDRTLLQLAVVLERDETISLNTNIAGQPEMILQPDRSFAMFWGSEFTGCGGLVVIGYGVAEAWMLVSRLARPRHIAAGVKLARAFFDRKLQSDLTRIEFFILERCGWRNSFARALGASEVAGASALFNAEPAIMYARGTI